jgi:DNA repair protein RadC
MLLYGDPSVPWECPQCGHVKRSNDDIAPDAFFRPWHVVYGRLAVKAYVESLGDEAHEWLLALFVDSHYQLLAVDNVARGDTTGVDKCFWRLIDRAHALNAAGFILVHNHPSGNPRPSQTDINITRRLAHVSRELDVPLLDHLIIARGEMREVGGW